MTDRLWASISVSLAGRCTLAVAGAAHGSHLLVVLGLLISIPIVVWGSTIILKWIERFPVIVYVGAGVLALTAAKMITAEPLVKDHLAPLSWAIHGAIIGGVLVMGYLQNRRTTATQDA